MSAPTSGLAQSHSIGLSNLHVAELTADNATSGITYGTVISMPEIISINIEPNNQEASLYADNKAVDTANSTPEYNISIEMAGLPLEYKAFLLGHTISGGTMTVAADDVAPFVGLAFETLKSNGKKRYVKFLKVKFSEPNENPNTKGDSVQFQTSTITGKAIFRAYDSKAYEAADEESGYTGNDWYTFAAVTPPSP